MKGRKVEVTIKQMEGKQVAVRTMKAVFHCWGYRPVKDVKDSPHVETVAVCELPGGNIRLVRPENVQFTDRPAEAIL